MQRVFVPLQSGAQQVSCSLADSWTSLLYDEHKNSVNPCFLAFVSSVLAVTLGIFVVFQLLTQLFNNHYGPYRIKYAFGTPFSVRSVGVHQMIRLSSVLVQVVLYVGLLSHNWSSISDIKTLSLVLNTALLALLVFPLHYIEPTRSIVASASLLCYWLVFSALNAIVLLEDIFSEYKLYVSTASQAHYSVIITTEVILVLNAIFVLALEAYEYKPSIELYEYFDLNDWNPKGARDFFTRFSYSYLKQMIYKAKETYNISLDDLPPYSIGLDNEVAYAAFLKAWSHSRTKTDQYNAKHGTKLKPSLFRPVLSIVTGFAIRSFLFDTLEFLASLAEPFLLQQFLKFVTMRTLGDIAEDARPPLMKGFLIATGLFAASIVSLVAGNRQYVNQANMQYILNTSLGAHIYNKGMTLSSAARKKKNSGSIVNHMSADMNYIANSPEVLTNLVLQPAKFVIYMVSIFKFLGPSVFAGIAVAVVMSPLSSGLVVFLIKYYKALMKHKDERTKLTSEIFNSIKSVKLYSWESSMLARLNDVRVNKELNVKRKLGILTSFITFVWNLVPFFMVVASLYVAAAWGKVFLTPDVLFPALSLFMLLTEPVLALPAMFSSIAEYKAANERLLEFFILEESEHTHIERTHRAVNQGEVSIEIKKAYFVWGKEKEEEQKPVIAGNADVENQIENTEDVQEDREALNDINFTAKRGHLTCVIGKVGSGKTTLLRAILGMVDVEEEKPKPVFNVNGSIAYCAQNAWILNAPVRENILFGRKYNKAFYDAVINACELTKDLEVLPDGDKTLVGEKGISLSGGQKTRLSLARAVYSRADVYILDDILSAVDAHVARSIINKVLGKNGLLASQTIILATNSVHVLHEADEIVLLEEKTITERGNYKTVLSEGGHIAELIREFGKQDHNSSNKSTPVESAQEGPPHDDVLPVDNNHIESYDPLREDKTLELTKIATRETIAPSIVSFGHDYADDFEDDPSSVLKTEEKEEIIKRGKVDMSVYIDFFKACNIGWIFCYLTISFVAMLVGILNTYILKQWSASSLERGENYKVGFFITLYTIVGLTGSLISVAGSFVIWYFCAVNGGRLFHERMAAAVIKSPMKFFETTPIGRILNRFTEDIGILDSQIFWILLSFASNIMRSISVLIVVVYNLPWMLFVMLVLLYVYNSLRQLFIPASREIKRLRASMKSPVYSHLAESIAGVETIEAYGQLERFIHKAKTNLNNFILCRYSEFGCNRWLAMRLQNLSAVVIYCSTLMILWSLGSAKTHIGPGLVGFIMNYALQVTNILNSITRVWAAVESDAVVVERVIEYCNLKPEAEMIIEDKRPPESWPTEGRIEFDNYSTKYRDNLDPVLNQISFVVEPGEKVGIVGRTGAGKSTLTLALFRIIEATEGKILIDGIDISSIGLYDLRSHLNIIPQDSQVFDGTVRQNLDPLNKYSDEELWRVLELSHLREHVENMKTKAGGEEEDSKTDMAPVTTGLEAKLSEGGGNLSAGQRQLMCLARALLNQSRILILDEATASVDVQTDRIVQQTIRSEFSDRTILTIAHRIDTILDSDKIIVLEKGRVKEHASPEELLSNQASIFYSLCKESGNLPDKYR